MDLKTITARREAIEADAPCDGCGATLASCKANRGKDPTAPPWFGCCAVGLELRPCRHRPSAQALLDLLKEIESGEVRDVEDMLLDSLTDRPQYMRLPRRRNFAVPDDGLDQERMDGWV